MTLVGQVLAAAAGLHLLGAIAAETVALRVDFARTNGIIHPLHGINKGPLAVGGMIDLTERQRELGVPFTRLHDCQWPYPEVVDIHAIFRNPTADASQPQNYDWALTDNYLAAVHQTGAQIIYRLGESIEHGTVRRFVHPPANPESWAAVCLGIIRHYNQAWADGQGYNIRYWEIWNEPENRPAMWSGTDDNYIALYRAAARAIKNRFPDLKVGGPAVGYSGHFDGDRFVPSEFVTNFLATCQRESLPLDFFSWHCYTAEPAELVKRAKAIRRLLDDTGFAKTESHLNEWNYLPGNSWEPFSKTAAAEARQDFYQEMSGAAGAAFVAMALIELQDAPVDISNFYHGETGVFGLFNEYGVPNRVFYTMRGFSRLASLRHRVEVEGGIPGKVAALAARQTDASKAAVLISNFHMPSPAISLQAAGLKGRWKYNIWVVGAAHPWTQAAQGTIPAPSGSIQLDLPMPGVALVELELEP